jgi:hypothetical protein
VTRSHQVWNAGHRLSLAWLALACAAVSYLEPTSLMHRTLVQGGDAAQLVLALIVAMAVGALFDVLCNDFPAAPFWPWLQRHRPSVYAMQALGNMLFVFVLLRPGAWTWVAGIYFVLSVGSLWVAGHGVYAERRGAAGV